MIFRNILPTTYRSAIVGMLTASGACFIAAPVLAQSEGPVEAIDAEAAKADITVQPLRGNISVLTGSGGNISVLTGADGKLMVDAGIAVSQNKIAEALASIGPGQIKYLIDTHYHWDHTDGNGWVHKAGATIIGHRNTLKDMSGTIRVDEWHHTFVPAPAGALPTILVDDQRTISFDGEKIVMNYYVLSHTNSDISVYYTKADILQTGDTWWNGYYPMIDYAAGGSIDGMIKAANANIALATDHTIVIPGHGPVGDRAQLIDYRDMLVAIRANVAALKSRGKSLDEITTAKPTAAYDAKWGGFVIGPDLLTELVYRGLPADRSAAK